jgi:thymidylate synthase
MQGVESENRTGVNTFSLFGEHLRVPIAPGGGFPLLTTKAVHFKSVAHELLWMLSGETNINYLREHKVKIWDEWASEDFRPELEYPDGELGPVYGYQWRSWPSEHGPVDQIANIIHDIEHNPTSRRIILNAWNVGQIDEMKLPPCHLMAQFNVEGEHLDCMMTMRSCDVFLGLPFNIAQYALLTRLIASVTGKKARELVVSIADAHLYDNHVTQAVIQIRREPGHQPLLHIHPQDSIDDYRIEHFDLVGYHPQPKIPAPVAV